MGGFALYPSPLGTALLALGGVGALIVVHAVSVGVLAALVVKVRPSLPLILAASPVALWVLPLGVDATAALLLVGGLVYGVRGSLLSAVGLHMAAGPLVAAHLFSRNRLAGVAACGVGALALSLTPYGSVFPSTGEALGTLLVALPRAAVVLLLACAPLLVARVDAGRFVPAFVGTTAIVLYATTAHVESGIGFGLSVFAASRYALPLSIVALVLGATRRSERPTTAPRSEKPPMRKLSLMLGVVAIAALFVVPAAFAQTVPAIPVDEYGDSLLSSLASAIGQIFPYAAAITAFAIGVGMVKRWLGHRKATRV